MKVSTVETEKVLKKELQVTATREELVEVFKASVIDVIRRLKDKEDMPPELGIMMTLIGADICAEFINKIFKEEK